MDTQTVVLLVILVVAIAVFMSERLRADVVAIGVMLSLGLTGLVEPHQVFSGLSSSAVMLVIAVSILTGGLFRTGFSAVIGRWLVRAGGASEGRMTALVMAAAGGLSLFMNNIASAAVIMPAVMDASRRTRLNASKLLMPMALATHLGGMATLFTTASIVSSGMLQSAGLPGLGVFDFAAVGGAAALLGFAYIQFIGRRALPDRSPAAELVGQQQEQADLAENYRLSQRLSHVLVETGSPLIGQSLEQTRIGSELGLTVLALERHGRRLPAPAVRERLKVGDILVLGGHADRAALLAAMGARVLPDLPAAFQTTPDAAFSEILVAPRSRAIGRSLRQMDFRGRHGLTVAAMWHSGQLRRTDLGDLVLKGSETLLVYGPREKLDLIRSDPDWIVLTTSNAGTARPGKMTLAVIILALSLVAAVLTPLPTAVVLFIGALAMVLTGCLTMEDAYQAIEWRSVFLVGSMLPVELALSSTGTAHRIGDLIISSLGAAGPMAVVAGLFMVAMVLNQFIPAGAAVPAVLVPVAIAAAQGLGADPRAFALVIAIATGTSVLTPFAHPVNVLVMGPGGYSFADYFWSGLPIVVTTFIATMVTLPLFWHVW